jgi:hypothetical protein
MSIICDWHVQTLARMADNKSQGNDSPVRLNQVRSGGPHSQQHEASLQPSRRRLPRLPQQQPGQSNPHLPPATELGGTNVELWNQACRSRNSVSKYTCLTLQPWQMSCIPHASQCHDQPTEVASDLACRLSMLISQVHCLHARFILSS